MPISPPGSKLPDGACGDAEGAGEGGFTLVELMVVVTVIALTAAIALWAMPDPRGRLADEALRLAARTRAARDTAIVEARPVSLWVTGGGYGFDRRVAGAWMPVADKPFRVERWSDGTRAALDEAGGSGGGANGRVRVIFDPTGIADRGADIRLTRGAEHMLVRVGADGSVRADAG